MQRALIGGRYALGDLLGSGGMAQVYLAHDEVLDRDVALKILCKQYAEDEEFVERFRREARSAARLSHPNIVAVYDQGQTEDGTYYIAMEYVPGETLKDRIRRDGPFEPSAAAGVALRIAEALSVAHEKGVIHRDIKPQNVLVTPKGDAKVTDFGIARAATATTTSRSSLIFGTAGYMSPEQAMGEPVGPESDLYSLGIVLYEMLTGEQPYGGTENPIVEAMKHVNEPPRSPREVNPEVPEPLDAVTVKLLAKNPEDRYASAAELAEDLERARSGLPPVAEDPEETEKMIVLPPPLPPGGDEQTKRTAVQPPVAVPIEAPGHDGRRRGRLFPVLGALLLLGAILLGGLAWALTQGFFGIGSAEVPSLEGLTREEAQQRLAESGLTLGDVGEAPSDSAPAGTVVEQDLQAGTSVKRETPVSITLSSGRERVTVPDLAGLSLTEAERALSEAGLKLGRRDETPSDTVPLGMVIKQNPTKGEEVEPGTAVDVVVSTGPPLRAPAVQAVPTPAPPVYDKKAEKKQKEAEKEAEKRQKEAEKEAEKRQKEAEKKAKKK
ncbi:MAG: Stk1 family PASTA domain-containing Ser/Thr kinase [Actinomycetota bacterium]|nr:Stk1 family PASTA domain-containing Ser/Thr kinase [Actinomycetota bacterium]